MLTLRCPFLHVSSYFFFFLTRHKAPRYFLGSEVIHVPVSVHCFLEGGPEGAHPGHTAHLLHVACLTVGVHPVSLSNLCMYPIEVQGFYWEGFTKKIETRGLLHLPLGPSGCDQAGLEESFAAAVSLGTVLVSPLYWFGGTVPAGTGEPCSSSRDPGEDSGRGFADTCNGWWVLGGSSCLPLS